MIPWSLRSVGNFLNAYGDPWLFRSVLATRPIETDPSSSVGVHSAVPHRYILAYLTAIKSFLRFEAGVAVYVHDDGSLTEDDKSLVRVHVPGATIVERAAADARFEREIGDAFLSQVRRSYTSYLKLFDPTLISDKKKIIIVDTDVLFLHRPAEVIDWIESGKGAWFHQARSWRGAKKASTKPPDAAQGGGGGHIQRLVTERIDEINAALGTEFAFMAGFNSGFVGYENGTVDFAKLKKLLGYLHGRLGDKIFKWGAEQTMHGLTLCGAGAVALSPDDYLVFSSLNAGQADAARFVHFIGEFRYHRFIYPRLAWRTNRQLPRS